MYVHMKMFSKVNDELCRFTGVQCNLTSAYHPQSNGLDEWFNQTLQRQLLKFFDSEQKKILMPYFFHIVFLFKIQPNIPPCFGVRQTSSFANISRLKLYHQNGLLTMSLYFVL